jgi:hypothetical protein
MTAKVELLTLFKYKSTCVSVYLRIRVIRSCRGLAVCHPIYLKSMWILFSNLQVVSSVQDFRPKFCIHSWMVSRSGILSRKLWSVSRHCLDIRLWLLNNQERIRSSYLPIQNVTGTPNSLATQRRKLRNENYNNVYSSHLLINLLDCSDYKYKTLRFTFWSDVPAILRL